MKKVALVAFVVLAMLSVSVSFAGEKFPTRRVEIIVPYGPGSGTDTTSRAFAPSLSKVLGVPVVVVNQAGSGGLRGMEFASKQPADGYTIFMCTPTHILSIVQNLSPVVLTKNFDPVAGLVQDSTLVTAKAGGRFKSWNEMAEHAKKNPGDVTVAGLSPKGIDAISMRMLAKAAGIEITFVPFASGAEATSAILGGHVDLGNEGPADAYDMIMGGEQIALLVASESRLAGLPEVPTSMDLGLNVVTGPWRSYAVPAGTPPERIKILQDAIHEAYKSPEFTAWLKEMMLDQRPGLRTAAELGKKWEEDLEFFTKAFKELGL